MNPRLEQANKILLYVVLHCFNVQTNTPILQAISFRMSLLDSLIFLELLFHDIRGSITSIAQPLIKKANNQIGIEDLMNDEADVCCCCIVILGY